MKKQSDNLTKSKKKASASSIRLALENRLLFDGAVVATATQVIDDKVAQDHAQESSKDSSADTTPDAIKDAGNIAFAFSDLADTKNFALQPLAVTSAASVGNPGAPNLYIVDSRAEGIHDLLTHPPKDAQVKVLDASRDGYQQIAEILHDRGNTTNLHVLTADLGGKPWLGSSQLSANITTKNNESLTDWGDALAAKANIVVHSREAINSSWLNHVNALTGGQASWTQDNHEQDQQVTVRPELVEGFHNNATSTENPVNAKDTKTAVDHDKIPTAVSAGEAHTVTSLVFIDTNVKDYQTLLQGIDPNAKVILLDPTKDGVGQIAQVVSQYDNIDALHIISHGSAGQLNLGSAVLNQSTIQGMYADELVSMGGHLSANADILIYGCNFGQGNVGLQATNALAALTGADIADSTNLTGSAVLGGDWVLERHTGMIESLSISVPGWNGLLTLSVTTDTNATHLANKITPTATSGITLVGAPTITTSSSTTFAGTFTTTSSNLGMSTGIVLGTGDVSQLSGSPSFGWGLTSGTAPGSGSSTTVSGVNQFDIAALTFSFTVNPGVTKIALHSVFGSEEYNQYVGSQFNDQFITTITGGVYTNETISNVPGTTTPIAINSVNNGTNSAYFRDNTIGSPPVSDVVLGGLTKTISDIVSVVPGTTYTVTIRIADLVDNEYNSAVFVDIFGASLQLDLDANDSSGKTGGDYQNTYIEGGAAVAIADNTDTAITNLDSTSIQSATITLTNTKSGDGLNVGTLPSGITASTTTNGSGQIVVTLSGASTPTAYQTALDAITFSNSAALTDSTTRDITVILNDGATDSNTAHSFINVTPVNDAPVGTNKTITINEDTVYTVTASDFGFTDPNDSPANTFANVIVTSLPLASQGVYKLNGVAVTANQVISVANINSNLLTFTPATNVNGGSLGALGFKLQDNGGTANGGVDTDPTAKTLNFTITPVNDAPVAVNDGPLVVSEGNALTIVPATLLANDTDIEGNTLTITSVQGAVNGTVALVSGNVVFTPTANYTGPASFTYTISDGNGGISTATTTISVVPPPIVDLNSGPTVTSPTGTSTSNLVTSGNFGTIAQSTPPGAWVEGGNAGAGAVVLNSGNGRWDWTSNPSATLTQAIIVPNSTSTTTNSANSTTVVTTSDAISSISFGLAWQNQDVTSPADNTLTLSYNGVIYATFTTFNLGTQNAGGLTGTWAYFNGASGPATTASVTNEATGTLTTVTIALPSITASGNLVFNYGNGPSGAGVDDIAIDNVVLTSTKTTVTTTTTADTADNNWAATYTENGSPVSIADTDSSVFDANSANMASATITLTNAQAGDRLLVNGSTAGSGTLPNGVAWTRTDTLVTFTNNDTKADYAAALALVQYENTTDTPNTSVVRDISVVVSDSVSTSNTAHAFVTVNAVNDPPVAANDSASTDEDSALTLAPGTLLANDTDLDGNPLAITSVQGAVNGTVALVSGNVVFTPTANYNGPASFTYTVSDGNGGTSTATVNVTVNAVNDPPVAANDSASTDEDSALTLAPGTLLANDTDLDGNPLAITSVQGAVNGTVALVSGNVVFTPTANYNGPASFTYTVSDGNGGTSTATVNVTVNAIDDVVTISGLTDGSVASTDAQVNESDLAIGTNPSGTGETAIGTFTLGPANALTSFTINGGSTITVAELAASATAPIILTGTNGTLIINGYNTTTGVVDYSFTLSSPANQSGGIVNDNFVIVTTDVDGDVSAPNTLAINIKDDVPIANADADETINVAGNPSSTASGNVFTSIGGTDPNSSDGIADNIGADGAVAGNPSPITGVVAGTGSPLVNNVGNAVASALGSITLNADGSYIYTPDYLNPIVKNLQPGDSITDTFTYSIADSDGSSVSTTLTITIVGVPSIIGLNDGTVTGTDGNVLESDLPSGTNSFGSGEVLLGSFQLLSPTYPLAELKVLSEVISLSSLTNLSTSPITITTANGTLLLNNYDALTGTVSYQYTLAAPINSLTSATDDFTVSLKDSAGNVTPDKLLKIAIIDDTPVALSDNGNVTEDGVPTMTGTVLTNDSVGADPNPNPVTPATVALAHGSLALNSDGSYTYTLNNADPAVNALNNGQSLTDTYTYTLTDGDGSTSTAVLTLTIHGHNDGAPSVTIPDENGPAPGDRTLAETAGASPGYFTVNAPAGLQSLTIGGTVVSEAQLGTLATAPVTISTDAGALILTGYNPLTGVVNYTYDPDIQSADGDVTDTIQVTVTDNLGFTNPANALAIVLTDSAPTANPDGGDINEDGTPTLTGNVLANDTLGADLNPNPVTPTTVALAHGSLVLNSDGSYTYTLNNADPAVNALNNGQSLTDAYTYTLTDGDGSTSTAVLTLTIHGHTDSAINSPPIASDDGPILTVANTPVTGNVLTNDTDSDGDTLSVKQFSIPGVGSFTADSTATIPEVGVIVIHANGSFTFTPRIGYAGPVPRVTYSVTDGTTTDTATLNFMDVPKISNQRENIGALIMLSNPTPQFFPQTTQGDYSLLPFRTPNTTWNSYETYSPSRLSLYGNLLDYDLYLTGSLRNQVVLEMQNFAFSVPPGTFRHTNPNEQLEYVATKLDGSPLPSWLHFDPRQLKFSGIPPEGAGDTEVIVKARDHYNNDAYATFKVTVNKERDYSDGKSIKLKDMPIQVPRHHAQTSDMEKQHESLPGKLGFNNQLNNAGKLSRLMESRALLDSLSQL